VGYVLIGVATLVLIAHMVIDAGRSFRLKK